MQTITANKHNWSGEEMTITFGKMRAYIVENGLRVVRMTVHYRNDNNARVSFHDTSIEGQGMYAGHVDLTYDTRYGLWEGLDRDAENIWVCAAREYYFGRV